MNDTNEGSILHQIRSLIKDVLDYASSVMSLFVARQADLALSGVLFVLLLSLASLLAVAAFVLVNVVIGMWLTHVTGSSCWSLTILAAFYAVLALIAAGSALRWFKRFRS